MCINRDCFDCPSFSKCIAEAEQTEFEDISEDVEPYGENKCD